MYFSMYFSVCFSHASILFNCLCSVACLCQVRLCLEEGNMVPALVDTITGGEEQEKTQGMVEDPDS